MNDILTMFDAAWNLIKSKEHWTQGDSARDRVGWDVGALSPDAVCWCSLGATMKVLGPDPTPYRRQNMAIIHDALRTAMIGNIADFNDHHTHEEVMHRWSLARRALEKNT